ncbi:hypothetical protein PMAYCL1PPCAC_23130 [Pristionchus mayeri]|uniref:Tc1-like transposase DDE domain-containing protein n=1 Tax=Pristionchus mayeri TaxID=1317129 RepID=A0AAN5I6B2_9BILA|nr:hypothetical protein PMAYCL1PPCAC_23130 [Pristionchus mayeri]
MSERSWKDKVVGWREAGLSYGQIVEKCHEIGKKVSKSQVYRILHKTFDTRRPYTPSTIVDKRMIKPIFDYIFESYMEDSQKKVSDLVKEIRDEFGEIIATVCTHYSQLSRSVVKKIRKEQCLEKGGVRYGHSVRLANRPPRLSFCDHHLGLGTMFVNHCFTDESMVQSGVRRRFVYVLKGDNSRRVKPRFKHPPSLMIWGGISWEGATPLVILRRGVTVDGGMYQKMIHKAYLKWAEKKYGGNVILVQDNARCHISQSTRAYFEREEIELILRMQGQMEKVVKANGGPVYD